MCLSLTYFTSPETNLLHAIQRSVATLILASFHFPHLLNVLAALSSLEISLESTCDTDHARISGKRNRSPADRSMW